MRWQDIRQVYPDQWLVIEILDSHTEGSRVVPDRIAVIETCPDGATAFERYRQLHREYPQRFVSFIHTSREELEMEERYWSGVWSPESRVLAPDSGLQTPDPGPPLSPACPSCSIGIRPAH